MPWVEGGGEKEVVVSFDEVKSVLVVSLLILRYLLCLLYLYIYIYV